MKGIMVLTDINSDLTNDYIKENNIEVVPMYYRFDNETIYGDENNLTIEEFYENFKTIIPKTMGCNPEKIKEKMEKCIKEGFDVLCIMFSSALSVSYNSALIAKQMIEEVIREAEVGKIYNAKVVKIEDFGCFVQIWPGCEGLVHISALAKEHVKKVEDVVSLGDEILVKCLGKDKKGRLNFSRRDALEPVKENKEEK